MNTLDAQALSQSFGPMLLGILLRSSALVIVGSVIILFLRSRTAELRHFVCHGMLCGLLLLPVIECVAPPIRHPSVTLTRAELAMFPDQLTSVSTARKSLHATTRVRHARPRPFQWILLATALYIFITWTLLLRLLVNLLHLNRLVNRSEPILDSDLRELGHEIWLHSLSQYRPQIRVSKDIRVPMAIGIEQVTILLPAHWTLWSREKLRAALIHEMAHVRRGDPQTACLASFTVCLFWLNPLVYWLRRQLVALAEEACDEAALLDFVPEEYARILIEFASEVGPKGRRLAAASTVAVHRSLIKTRLEHIFSVGRQVQGSQPLLRALLIAIFVPALYLAASARFDQQQTAIGTDQATTISIATQQQADQLESQLLRDPENLNIRGVLMAFYVNQGNESAFTPHLLWVINHHPEAPIAAMKIYSRRDSPSHSLPDSVAAHTSANSDYELISKAWDNAVNEHPNSADVIFHAGLFIERNDPRSALDLFTRAAAVTPADSQAQAGYLHAIAVIYAAAVVIDRKASNPSIRIDNIAMDQNLASTLRTEVEISNDPALLCQVGITLVQFGQDEEGLLRIQRAIDLDPANPKWKEALDSAKAEPVRRQNLHEFISRQLGRGVRIGAEVAEANLITKVEPKYPPLALQARISGMVEFTVDIGADGKIQSLQLVGGHPLLVDAAKNAVLQ
jgi:beta-lactamase regulating signal transducer with metallopeptidase domain